MRRPEVHVLEQVLAMSVVVAFALVNGVNDGGTLVSLGLRTALSRTWLRLVVLVGALALTPVVLDPRVAVTLAERLVTFEGDVGRLAVLCAVLATLGVVWLLAARGWPTSLTLGLVGALAGAGLGAGLPVGWRAVGVVLVIAAVAPALGVVAAMVLHGLVTPLVGAVPVLRRALPSVGHALQSLAYGANDGQKMLAVLAVVAGTSPRFPDAPQGMWVVVVGAFAVGCVVGIARIGPTIDGKVLPLRTEQVALAQLSGSGAVLGSAVLAGPVSLIQAVSGGLVGAGVSVTPGRVRWAAVGQIVLAWLVTLPAAFVAGGLLTAGLNVVWP